MRLTMLCLSGFEPYSRWVSLLFLRVAIYGTRTRLLAPIGLRTSCYGNAQRADCVLISNMAASWQS